MGFSSLLFSGWLARVLWAVGEYMSGRTWVFWLGLFSGNPRIGTCARATLKSVDGFSLVGVAAPDARSSGDLSVPVLCMRGCVGLGFWELVMERIRMGGEGIYICAWEYFCWGDLLGWDRDGNELEAMPC